MAKSDSPMHALSRSPAAISFRTRGAHRATTLPATRPFEPGWDFWDTWATTRLTNSGRTLNASCFITTAQTNLWPTHSCAMSLSVVAPCGARTHACRVGTHADAGLRLFPHER